MTELMGHSDPLAVFDRRGRQVFLAAVRRHRRPLILLIVISVLGSSVLLAEPLAYRGIIDGLIRSHQLSAIWYWLVVLIGTSVLTVVSRWLMTVRSAKLEQTFLLELDIDAFDCLQRMPFASYTKTPQGALLSRITNDIENAGLLFGRFIPDAATSSVSFLGGIGLVMSQSLLLGCVVAAMLLLTLPTRFISRSVRQLAREQMAANSTYLSWITERLSVSGVLLVRLFGDFDKELDEMKSHARRARRPLVSLARCSAWSAAFVSGGTRAATIAILAVGSILISHHSTSVGTIVLFLFAIQLIYQPISTYPELRVQFVRGTVGLMRIQEVVEMIQESQRTEMKVESASVESPLSKNPEAERVPGTQSVLEFDGVTFTYPLAQDVVLASLDVIPDMGSADERVILEGISFHVHEEETVAVVGPSGAGKTTIAMLASGMYFPDTGSVKIIGKTTKTLSRKEIASFVGLVSQDTFMLHDSIRNNLLYAKPDASASELVAACMCAGIHDFIRRLPAGYGTIVGERGVRLSGGQRQRIAIARVLLKKPRLVVLDEATAHLDIQAERMIQQTFESAFATMPRLVIAHRLSTIVAADRILVVESGRIVESGTHRDLLANRGLYADLYQDQVGITKP
jgi:ATP-binding cassette, subfamily B, bacterial